MRHKKCVFYMGLVKKIKSSGTSIFRTSVKYFNGFCKKTEFKGDLLSIEDKKHGQGRGIPRDLQHLSNVQFPALS